MFRAAEARGLRLDEPYSMEPLRSYALGLDATEINRPRPKGIALRAYPSFWTSRYRLPKSFQVVAGIRDLHAALLLADTRTNPGMRHRDVASIYRRLATSTVPEKGIQVEFDLT